MTMIQHPLASLLDVDDSDRDILEYDQITDEEVNALAVPATPVAPEKDEEDTEVDRKIDEVYQHALDTFQNQMAYTEVIEPRYAARNAEVAATYLNIALNAAGMRARVKGDRKRAGMFIPGAVGGKTVNNTIVATREESSRMISVDAETKELK